MSNFLGRVSRRGDRPIGGMWPFAGSPANDSMWGRARCESAVSFFRGDTRVRSIWTLPPPGCIAGTRRMVRIFRACSVFTDTNINAPGLLHGGEAMIEFLSLPAM